MKSRLISILTLYILCALTASALAHDNEVVHPGVSTVARGLLDTAYGDKYKEVTWTYFDITGDCNDVREGSIKEDNLLDSATLCGVAPLSWLEHAYNPINGKGWGWGTGTALNKALTEYQEAVDAYGADNKGRAYFQLGRVAHLLEDMTSPAHVHSDVHATGDDFEAWSKLQNNYASYSYGTGVTQPGSTLTDFFTTLSLKTYYASSFQAVLYQDGAQPVDPASELAQMFPNKIHYVSVGLGGVIYWTIDGVGEYEAELFVDDWWQCADDPGYFYIENARGDNDVDLYPPKMRSDLTNRYSSLTSNTKSLIVRWAETLFPMTVNYTAGLYKFFFDNVACSTVDVTHNISPEVTTVPVGGTLPVLVVATNNSSCAVTFNVQSFVILPDGNTLWSGQGSASLAGGEARTHTHFVNVPPLEGGYTFGIVLTDANGTQIDLDSFSFTVVASQ